MRISSDLAQLAEQTSLSNPESVEQLRNIVEQLDATAAANIDAQIALRTMMIQLRKVARSEQLTFVRAADVYKERIRRINRNVERLGFEKDDPLLETLSAIRKTRRIEISVTVGRLSKVEEFLEAYAEERPDIVGDLVQMRDEIRQTRLDITNYLEDRGDDMSFIYRAQLSEITGRASPAGMPNELAARLDDIADAATLFAAGDSAVEDGLSGIRSAAGRLQDAELAAELMEWVSALEFAREYEPQRPPEKITAAHWVMVACLFLIGFFLYAPDSQIAVAAAIDFGHHKGASSVSGFINGCGAISAIFGGVGVGTIAQLYSWDILLTVFAFMTLLAGLLLLPKWHTVPTAETE